MLSLLSVGLGLMRGVLLEENSSRHTMDVTAIDALAHAFLQREDKERTVRLHGARMVVYEREKQRVAPPVCRLSVCRSPKKRYRQSRMTVRLSSPSIFHHHQQPQQRQQRREEEEEQG